MIAAATLDGLTEYASRKCTDLGIAELLSSNAVTRARRALGGSHTVVTYPPLNALDACDPDDVLSAITQERGINLYAHIAYCEFLCPFCHYETEFRKLGSKPDWKSTAYMDALSCEWKRWASLLPRSSLASLYVGGGTPTALPLATICSFLELLLQFPRDHSFSLCVETSPATAAGKQGLAALRAIADLGTTRFSIGVQSTNDQLLRRSRGHDAHVLNSAMSNLASLSISFNIDLIQDLPNQDDDGIINDLKFVASAQPDQVTWYIMRLDQNSAWRRRLDNEGLEVASAYESARRRLMIIEGMRRLGYDAQSGNRFQRRPEGRDRYKSVRAGLSDTLLGIGASAYSHGWGWFFRNTYSRTGTNGISDYVERIKRDGTAIYDGVKMTLEDQIASRFINGIRSVLRLGNDLAAVPDYDRQVSALLETLVNAQLATRDDSCVTLTPLGRVFEEEICAMFYPKRIRERLIERGRI